MNELILKVQEWAVERNLHKADPAKQMLKVIEEVGETAGALAKGNQDALQDGIGDVLVTMIILSMQVEMDIKECLEAAYNEIKDRKGKTVNGVFIKQ